MIKKEEKRLNRMKDLSQVKEKIPPKDGERLLDWEGEKVSIAEYKKRFSEKYRPKGTYESKV